LGGRGGGASGGKAEKRAITLLFAQIVLLSRQIYKAFIRNELR